MSVVIPAGTPACSAGTLATVLAPGASTTDRACQQSWSVCTTYPRSVCRTDVTVVFARTGAAFSFAYPAMSSATSDTAR